MTPLLITSEHNTLVKMAVSLQTRKGRKKHNSFLAQGDRVISTLIQANCKPTMLFATQDFVLHEEFAKLPITLVSSEIMKKISTTVTPSGLVAIFQIPESPDTKLIDSGIVLAGISDPGNMGTLLRTCAALGKKTVIIVEGTDIWSPKVIQATAGTINSISIFHMSWQELLKNKKGLPLVALVPRGGIKPQGQKYKDSLLVIGSEAHGLTQEQIDTCDTYMTIPMAENVESLNAAIAGAIAMYATWFC